MAISLHFLNNSAYCSNINAICYVVCYSLQCNSEQKHLPPCYYQWLGFHGSDKLAKSSLVYMIKWIMAMALWLTLLK